MHPEQFAREFVQSRDPQNQVIRADGYGSTFKRQDTYKEGEATQADVLLVVNNVRAFHAANKKKNPSDYLFNGILPASFYAWANNLPAAILYHPYIPFTDSEGTEHTFKYGVQEKSRAIADAYNAESLYTAGRRHKSMLNLTPETENANLVAAFQENFRNALRIALLQLPHAFSEEDLFLKITQISYTGDNRKKRGFERMDKELSIVRGTINEFRELYAPFIQEKVDEGVMFTNVETGNYEKSEYQEATSQLLDELPVCVRREMGKVYSSEQWDFLSDEELLNLVTQAVTNIVKPASKWQTIKGVVFAGKRMVPYGIDKRMGQLKSGVDVLQNPKASFFNILTAYAVDHAITTGVSQNSSVAMIVKTALGAIPSSAVHWAKNKFAKNIQTQEV